MTHQAYDHVQRGYFHWLLYALGAINATLTVVLVDSQESDAVVTRVILGTMAGVFVLLGVSFQHLRVRDEGDSLQVAFGPLAIVRRQVRYSDILSAKRGRSRWLDGWGIHWMPDKGWIWNIRGRDVVELKLNGGRMRVGTDDPDGLLEHLQQRIGSRALD